MTEYTRPDDSAPTLSMQWKSENVIVSGLRDSTMLLYDTRARDEVVRLRHGTSVMKLHCIDDHKILLRGPSHLDMYDLRYSKPAHEYRSTEPWLHYPNYDNQRWKSFDIDVSPRLGLLAVSLETTTEIWNLWTGNKIRDVSSSPSQPNPMQKSEVVMFTRNNHKAHFFTEESDPVGLLVADESQVLEWDVEAR